MEVTHGLFSHMVLQRKARNQSDTVVQGTCDGRGRVLAIATLRGRKVRSFESAVLGQARDGKFRARLAGLPAGGPYRIELWIEGTKEKVVVDDVLVGDVWILAGQSNMQGIGWMKWAEKPDPRVRAFFMNDEWGIAKDPLHEMPIAVDPIHINLIGGVRPPRVKNPLTGVGPGLPFAKEMLRRTGVPQGIICCAHGGTSMQQWDPQKKLLDGTSLYGATLRRFEKNGSAVAGIAWYQGESDANEDAAQKYTQRMIELVREFRRDFKAPNLPFVAVQISRVAANFPSSLAWNSIQEQQRRLPKVIKKCLTVPAIDLMLDDLIHIGGPDNSRLGRRIAEAMDFLGRGKSAGLPPIEIKSTGIEKNPKTGNSDIVVEFANVKGRLTSQGYPTGFTLSEGGVGNFIYRVDLGGNRAILRTSLPAQEANNKSVQYGQGYNPYCNVTDEAGRSLPVFGPLPIGAIRALTPFVTELQVSPLLPSAGKLNGLSYPSDLGALRLETKKFAGNFCDRHLELGARAPEDVLVWYRTRVTIPEPMKARLNLGYDGPVKVWIDREEKFFDPEGTNPANPEDQYIEFDSTPGEHEVLVALASNNGKAWGVFLRYERTDLTKKQLEAGAFSYAMPRIVV
ncbi:MAG TPA: sialate O-acetylesterase [Planctomycetota bacterium]|nr:sialate O-acetylesterase [Planctomycetota bacterium]